MQLERRTRWRGARRTISESRPAPSRLAGPDGTETDTVDQNECSVSSWSCQNGAKQDEVVDFRLAGPRLRFHAGGARGLRQGLIGGSREARHDDTPDKADGERIWKSMPHADIHWTCFLLLCCMNLRSSTGLASNAKYSVYNLLYVTRQFVRIQRSLIA